jgi:hypothetical protein
MCTQTADLGGGISAVSTQWESANCREAAGASACTCSTGAGYFQFELPDADAQMSTCTDALEICGLVADAEPTGPIECAPTSQNSWSTSCSAQITCTQYADVNGIAVGMQGGLGVYCDQVDDSTWACDCNSGNQSDSYEVATTTPWEACSDAMVVCPDLVDVVIGGGGGGYYPPYYYAPVVSGSGSADGGL